MDVASRAFSDAANYDQARKGYTLDSARLFVSKLQFIDKYKENGNSNNEVKTILELGAGTGQYTKVLMEAIKGSRVKLLPSEPLNSMGDFFKRNFPDLDLICCKGEHIPLPDCSIDAVVAANALHYLSDVESLTEISRILVPGGVLAFICNYVNLQEAPWAQTMFDLSEKYYQRVGIPLKVNKNGIETGWEKKLLRTGKFDDIHKEFTDHFDFITEDDTVKMFMSFGAFQHCNGIEQEDVQKICQKLLQDNFSGKGKIMDQLPMRCYLYWTRKKDFI